MSSEAEIPPVTPDPDKANLNSPPFQRPKKRPLKIYASDPMAGRAIGNRARVEVDNESLDRGPSGARIKVVDYDSEHRVFYPPVNLEDPAVLMQGGLDPSESDPRFHQQMVYAVAMRTLENFDRALGRTMQLGRRVPGKPEQPLLLMPHAFIGANAYYAPDLHAILFGYFRADEEKPGPNLPGQTVFSCLSHDIVAHEMTHAIVHQLRPFFMAPSNEDVLAFHEGFSDIVALFQHFSFKEVVREQLRQCRGDVRKTDMLSMARQFGFAMGTGRSLRSAVDSPDPQRFRTTLEPHDRGALLVAAVFDAFATVLERRNRDLFRIASNGSGVLPDGELSPDLVNRVADEAARLAQAILDRCIRAFDYLAPVDITFGDYLRALVTADYDVTPDDELGLRACLIEGFRKRGIYPDGVVSLAEEALLWDSPLRGSTRLQELPELESVRSQEMYLRAIWKATSFERDEAIRAGPEALRERRERLLPEPESDAIYGPLHAYACANNVALGLAPNDPAHPIQVKSVHSVFRVLPNGLTKLEHIIQFVQKLKDSENDYGGIPLRGGTTIVVDGFGMVQYVISKPLPLDSLSIPMAKSARVRAERQAAYLQYCDSTDPMLPYYTQEQHKMRMKLRMSFANLHRRG